MKKSVAAVVFIISNLFFMNTWAQIKLSSINIKEILVHNAVAGLNGGISANIKVISEEGQWRSYLVRKTNGMFRPYRKPYDSTFHKFIATLNPALLNNMLKGIAIIKPAITSTTFGLTAHELITELNNSAKLSVTNAPNFEKLITQKIINTAIAKGVVGMTVMDDYEYCEITIITLNNDTVKLNTSNLCPTKLPWTIKNHSTYDMAINNFVVAAIGSEDVPNKTTLNISSLKESIYKYIDDRNAGAPIATFKWKYDYPVNLKLLSEYFTINEGLWYGNVYSCVFKTKTMPANVILESRIDMTNKEDIKLVIEYAALIDRYIKANNFVFKYYNNRPNCQINFSYVTGQSPYYSLNHLIKKLPEQAKTDSTQVISFWASAPDDSSYWIMFPDNKALLTYHAVTTSDGKTVPIYPPQDPNASWYTKTETYYLFDDTGKVLNQGLGL